MFASDSTGVIVAQSDGARNRTGMAIGFGLVKASKSFTGQLVNVSTLMRRSSFARQKFLCSATEEIEPDSLCRQSKLCIH